MSIFKEPRASPPCSMSGAKAMSDFIWLIAGAAIPSIVLMLWFYNKDKSRPEPLRLVFKSVLLGFLGTVPAIFLELLLEGAGNFLLGSSSFLPILLADLFRVAWTSFVTAALVEEGIKLFCIKTFLYKKAAFDEVMDGIVYAVCVSLGFAFAENILYGLSDRGTLVLRAFTAVPMHAAAAGIMGYWIGMAKRQVDAKISKSLVGKGFGVAVLFHGSYDFFLFASAAFPLLALPCVVLAITVLLLGLLHLGSLVKKAKAVDDVLAALHSQSLP